MDWQLWDFFFETPGTSLTLPFECASGKTYLGDLEVLLVYATNAVKANTLGITLIRDIFNCSVDTTGHYRPILLK